MFDFARSQRTRRDSRFSSTLSSHWKGGEFRLTDTPDGDRTVCRMSCRAQEPSGRFGTQRRLEDHCLPQDGRWPVAGETVSHFPYHLRRSANTGRLTIFRANYSPITRFSDNKFLIRSQRLTRIRPFLLCCPRLLSAPFREAHTNFLAVRRFLLNNTNF